MLDQPDIVAPAQYVSAPQMSAVPYGSTTSRTISRIIISFFRAGRIFAAGQRARKVKQCSFLDSRWRGNERGRGPFAGFSRFSVRPRERGDPERATELLLIWIPAGARMNEGGWRAKLALLPLEQPHDLGFCQRIEMQVEADHGGRGVRLDVKLLGLHRKDREKITVRMVAFGRARTAITRRAKVRPRLQCARRQLAACAARAELKFADARRNIDHQPVPKSRAGGRIGIIAGHGEALGT